MTLTQIGMFCKFETFRWPKNHRKIAALRVQKAVFLDSNFVIRNNNLLSTFLY